MFEEYTLQIIYMIGKLCRSKCCLSYQKERNGLMNIKLLIGRHSTFNLKYQNNHWLKSLQISQIIFKKFKKVRKSSNKRLRNHLNKLNRMHNKQKNWLKKDLENRMWHKVNQQMHKTTHYNLIPFNNQIRLLDLQ